MHCEIPAFWLPQFCSAQSETSMASRKTNETHENYRMYTNEDTEEDKCKHLQKVRYSNSTAIMLNLN